jgi:hypothetical protein
MGIEFLGKFSNCRRSLGGGGATNCGQKLQKRGDSWAQTETCVCDENDSDGVNLAISWCDATFQRPLPTTKLLKRGHVMHLKIITNFMEQMSS